MFKYIIMFLLECVIRGKCFPIEEKCLCDIWCQISGCSSCLSWHWHETSARCLFCDLSCNYQLQNIRASVASHVVNQVMFCRCWVVFVCVGDKWAQAVLLLTAAPELRCYLQLFSLLLQLLLALWPQGLQQQAALWDPHTRTDTVHTSIHLYKQTHWELYTFSFSLTQEGNAKPKTRCCLCSCHHIKLGQSYDFLYV